MFAHIYCPDFLVQCERLFQPELRSQSVIIYESIMHHGREHVRLLACSSQARELGFEKNLGSEQLNQLLEQFSIDQNPQTLIQLQPNRELYADMSERLFSAVELLAPSVSAISSDEACIELTQYKHLTSLTRNGVKPPEEQLQNFAIKLRHSVKQWLGLEIFVGIGPTKTLAYLACKAAEIALDHEPHSTNASKFSENRGTAVLSNSGFDQSLLAKFPTSRIRGISSKALSRLSALGIHTALELSQASSQLIGKRCSVLVEHIAVELSGLTSQLRSERLEPKQFNSKNSALSIAKTKPTNTLIGSEIQKHLASYAKAYLKAQLKGQSTSGVPNTLKRIITAMINNAHTELVARQLNCHKVEIVLERTEFQLLDKTFSDCKSISLREPSDTLGTIKKLCQEILESMLCCNSHYRSISLKLECQDHHKTKQAGLFETLDEFKRITQLISKGQQSSKSHRFTLVQRYCELDDLSNLKTGPYSHNRHPRSPSYTSQWHELLRVN